ncbi:MAG: exo-alpha-sialidase, partial [Anaerolineales bacterium]|nr:exo-alpha-sialidase [Anaerolineales bacterium]
YNLTVRLSYDEGKTWPVSKVIDPGPSAYSDLVIQDDMKVGVLYERGNQGGISYVNFPLEWLTDVNDKLTLEKKER